MTPKQIESFRVAYADWIRQRRSALDERRWKDAFAGFPSPELAAAELAPCVKPLARLRLGLFTTAGLYVKEKQAPFDASNVEGDSSFRELPVHLPEEQLGIAHEHYNHASAQQDLNTVYPVERLMEWVGTNRLGALAEVAISTSGYCTRLDQIAEVTAPRIAARFGELGVDAVLHVPV